MCCVLFLAKLPEKKNYFCIDGLIDNTSVLLLLILIYVFCIHNLTFAQLMLKDETNSLMLRVIDIVIVVMINCFFFILRKISSVFVL